MKEKEAKEAAEKEALMQEALDDPVFKSQMETLKTQ